MTNPDPASQKTVLIVSDLAAEAALVKSLLDDDFNNVLVAVGTDSIPHLFQDSRASVLVLAYRDLARAAKFYQDKYRQSTELLTPLHPHRTVALCDRKDVRAAYDLCSSGQLDDYVQFWPTTYDAPRLLMSVSLALQACATHSASSGSAHALNTQRQRLEELEALLSHYLGEGAGHMSTATRTLTEKESEIRTALAALSKQILKAETVQLRAGCAPGDLSQSILPQVNGMSQTLDPLTDWVGKMEKAVTPHIHDTRDQLQRALSTAPTILIVDDDQFQREMAGKIVESAGYRAAYAGNGAEALQAVLKSRPDLILMDVMMPGMTGLEVVQRLKMEPAFANVPFIMVTGKSERVVVLESVRLGVADFVVKPMDRKLLLDKIARLLAPADPAPLHAGIEKPMLARAGAAVDG